ncbi:hypothetical protein [Lentibacillus juripiscarius]|uniref:Antigen I/II N-terminal domain-containing protein n=1 Tax=Lentibacillus juripiscarius TaxID=257446 RepID=A0ABW5V4Z6_9BACI
MKKALLFIIPLLFLFAACSDDTSNGDAQTADDKGAEEENASNKNASESESDDDEKIEVDKNLFSVTVTLPKSFVESDAQNIDETIANAEEEGMKVTQNDDGSLTYKMTKAKHKEMMDEMRSSVEESIEEIKTSGDYKSIQDITANNSFSKFQLIVNKKEYNNSMDAFAILGLGMNGMMYQLFDGASEEDYDVTIQVKDAESGEVFETVQYPEALDTEEQN